MKNSAYSFGGIMEILGEFFIEIIGSIAEIIGEELAESFIYNSNSKHPAMRFAFAIILGILTWALIAALSFATYVLFVNSHPVAGFFVAIATFFFLILFISVIVKINRIKKEK
ncbi:MAG: hypothetical protein IKB73_04695 [Ruminococcus sp.]|nr:hypothetical protein [Ruminococcus sp.]